MDTKNIKIGKITEEELVNLFGSDAQKKSYKEKGRFVSNCKNNLFKKVNKYHNGTVKLPKTIKRGIS